MRRCVSDPGDAAVSKNGAISGSPFTLTFHRYQLIDVESVSV